MAGTTAVMAAVRPPEEVFGTSSATGGGPEVRRLEWLESLGFEPEDQARSEALQSDVIAPHLDAIVDAVVGHVADHGVPGSSGVMRVDLGGLRLALRGWLPGLGVDFERSTYFQTRRSRGILPAEMAAEGMEPCVLHLVQQAILVHTRPEVVAAAAGLAAFLHRIIALDLSLALSERRRRERDLARSVEQLQRERRALLRQASTDVLTGLPNRAAMTALLDGAMARGRRSGGRLCVAMVDIDLFKRVNDRYGHAVGDLVLRGVAGRMASGLRSTDVVGRFGGEEFLVVLEGTAEASGALVMERVRQRVGNDPFQVDGHEGFTVTVSIGVAIAGDEDDASSLLARADAALYAVKRNGRDRVAVNHARPKGRSASSATAGAAVG